MSILKSNGLLDAALRYARAGWPVLPLQTPGNGGCSCGKKSACDSAGKHPRWHADILPNGLNGASADEEKIRRWWEAWPEANVGIATGAKSGLVVLDVDPRNTGDQTLQALIATHGPLPTTITSETGGGGRHYFFKHPGGYIKGRSGALGDGLDVKADGGSVVAPPSLHPSGKHYEWARGCGPGDVALASLPEWLLAELKAERGNRQAADGVEGAIPDGKRHQTLLSLAGVMRCRGMGGEAIYVALEAENRSRCDPPLAVEEIRAIADSVGKYPPSQEFHLTDLGNAQRLVAAHGLDIRFCHPWQEWLVWDGQRWKHDFTGEIYRRAKDTIRSMYGEAAALGDEQKRRRLASFALESERAGKIKALVELARSEPGIPVLPEQLDKNLWLLNCRNGAVDLRTGDLRPHERDDLITQLVDVDYDTDAVCPMWEDFLCEILRGDESLIAFLQKALGYALTGDLSEQCVFFLHGQGANGKSTLLETFRGLLGDYGYKCEFTTFLEQRSDKVRNDVAALAGRRFVTAIEVAEGRRLDEALLKESSGGDAITTRYLFHENFTFEPQFKVFFGVNHRPIIRGTDYAMWRRIKLIPFDFTIPLDKRDPRLKLKLRQEYQGILAWVVRGCLKWQSEGLGDPDQVKKATAEYRTEMDTLGLFIGDACCVGEGLKAQSTVLYRSYVHWCDQNGEKPITQTAFGRRMTERGFRRQPKGIVWYFGIGLMDESGGLEGSGLFSEGFSKSSHGEPFEKGGKPSKTLQQPSSNPPLARKITI